MKNKFIKSLMNSLNSRERERERGLSGDLSMKKESNGIGENKNSKKISKNNKIISSILAVVMCCQSLVGAVKPDSQLVDSKETDSKETVEIMEGKDKDGVEISEDKNDVKENDEDEGEDENEDKSKNKSFLVKAIGIGASALAVVGTLIVVVRQCAKCSSGTDELEEDTEEDMGDDSSIETETVKIGGVEYQTYNIGERLGGDGDEIRFKNLWIGYEYPFGIYDFTPEITKYGNETLQEVKVKPDCENEIGDLSSYSKFIVSIIRDGDYLSTYLKNKKIDENNIKSIVLHACKLLEERNDPEFRLAHVCVSVILWDINHCRETNYYFLIPAELAEYLE
ncbi:MAG: hypothetical protein CfP315_0236 [Candidatus Improbicoccus pseudotrichonymphae]|uniref:Uncharacterized protein n=1 Tax=Candidatus Improbicoccus pseudotrichonymphae TaxID=3033792 RepID=A0AA48IGS1_9FIRM|nr:MAG: hypothetical protein CfP315_0236 [Candidatus Improbicoccus pseudotrichonymphae]